MLITKRNHMTGKDNQMELDITLEQIRQFEQGMFVQDAFPNLTPTEREFILTGMSVEEQKAIFG